MQLTIAEEVREAGRQVASATEASLVDVLNASIERFLGWPYKVASGYIVDPDDSRTDAFTSIIYVAPGDAAAVRTDAIPADWAAAVIDASESMDRDAFRAAYARIALSKRLRKTPGPDLKDAPNTTVTLGVIFALRSNVPLNNFAEELERLNAQTPSREWPDMVVVASTGAINYAVQFPGESSLSGDLLPPAEGALARIP